MMEQKELGQTGIQLSAIGLGCMSMNHAYGQPNDEESIATLELALEIGVNFWDTADIYANGQNEVVISAVLSRNRQKIVLATKFGFLPYEKGRFSGFDGSPEYMKTAVEQSLRRLKTDYIDLYYAHRIDPKVPVEEVVGAMGRLVTEGKVRAIGLSEASSASIRKAHATFPISAVQSEYSILTRNVEQKVLPVCSELGITFVPFSPLARGLLSNTLNTAELAPGDFRATLPRYQLLHKENNEKLSAAFAKLAEEKGCTAAQLAIAWVLNRAEQIVPIPGTKKRKYLLENSGAVEVIMSQNDYKQIEDIVSQYPDTGERYNKENEKYVDNEPA